MFVGIVNRNTEYLITDGVIFCSTVRRLPDNEAYDKKCIDDIIVKHTDFVKPGSRTAPIAIRFTPTSNEIAPDLLKPVDFTTHRHTGGSRG